MAGLLVLITSCVLFSSIKLINYYYYLYIILDRIPTFYLLTLPTSSQPLETHWVRNRLSVATYLQSVKSNFTVADYVSHCCLWHDFLVVVSYFYIVYLFFPYCLPKGVVPFGYNLFSTQAWPTMLLFVSNLVQDLLVLTRWVAGGVAGDQKGYCNIY